MHEHLHSEGTNQPETPFVKAMEESDAAYIKNLPTLFPPTDRSMKSGLSVRSGYYWGAAVAIAATRLGAPLGFEMTPDQDDLMAYGSYDTINYWLTLQGFEHRKERSSSATSEARSGLFTLLEQPWEGQLFEHLYAARTGAAIEDIILRDPMSNVRAEQPATAYEIVDHERVEQLYKENPEQAIRMYLSRRLPTLKHLRAHLENTKADMAIVDTWEEVEGIDEHTKTIYSRIVDEKRENAAFDQARLTYWQTEYDFTVGLLMEGYKPYTLEETVPVVEEYILGLLFEHSELSPTHLQTEVPDVITELHTTVKKFEDKRGND